jgi:hypothetical protein
MQCHWWPIETLLLVLQVLSAWRLTEVLTVAIVLVLILLLLHTLLLLLFSFSLLSSLTLRGPCHLFSCSEALSKFFDFGLVCDRFSFDFNYWDFLFLLRNILVSASSLAPLAFGWGTRDLGLA